MKTLQVKITTTGLLLIFLFISNFIAAQQITAPFNPGITQPTLPQTGTTHYNKKGYISKAMNSLKNQNHSQIKLNVIASTISPFTGTSSSSRKYVKYRTYDFESQKLTGTVKSINPCKVFTSNKEYGFWASGGELIPIYSSGQNNLTVIKPRKPLNVKFNKKEALVKTIAAEAGSVMVVPGVIPPKFYEDIFGRPCCEDCWAVHRSLNLPCSLDLACCAGTCGYGPGCDDNGPGGPGGNDKPGADCQEQSELVIDETVTVSVDGKEIQCQFTGVITDTYVNGECLTSYDGTLSDCFNVVNDPSGGICETQSEYF